MQKLSLIIGLSFISIVAHAEPASDQSIREYFKVSGQEDAAIDNINNLLPTLKQMLGNDIPEDLIAELARTDNLVEKFIPIYRKYFTESEMQDLIIFYKTPTGLKFAKSYSKISTEFAAKAINDGQMTVINYYIQKGKFSVGNKK